MNSKCWIGSCRGQVFGWRDLSWLGTVRPWPSTVRFELKRATASSDVAHVPCTRSHAMLHCMYTQTQTSMSCRT